jgi:hypothetical protein
MEPGAEGGSEVAATIQGVAGNPSASRAPGNGSRLSSWRHAAPAPTPELRHAVPAPTPLVTQALRAREVSRTGSHLGGDVDRFLLERGRRAGPAPASTAIGTAGGAAPIDSVTTSSGGAWGHRCRLERDRDSAPAAPPAGSARPTGAAGSISCSCANAGCGGDDSGAGTGSAGRRSAGPRRDPGRQDLRSDSTAVVTSMARASMDWGQGRRGSDEITGTQSGRISRSEGTRSSSASSRP